MKKFVSILMAVAMISVAFGAMAVSSKTSSDETSASDSTGTPVAATAADQSEEDVVADYMQEIDDANGDIAAMFDGTMTDGVTEMVATPGTWRLVEAVQVSATKGTISLNTVTPFTADNEVKAVVVCLYEDGAKKCFDAPCTLKADGSVDVTISGAAADAAASAKAVVVDIFAK